MFNYLTPGQLIYVTGEPYVRMYADKNGDNAVSLEVRVYNVELLGGTPKEDCSTGAEASQGPELVTDYDNDLPF